MSLYQSEYICDYCSRSFTRKYNLLTHIENCHLNSTCYCSICEQQFGSPAGLQLHLSRGHNRFGHPFPECDLCGRIFTRKQNITSHMITVHLQVNRPEIQCNLCSKFFTTERNLKRHINQLHNPNFTYLTCDECHKIFKGKHSLIAHLQTVHTNVKGVVKCNLCAKIYTNKRNLKRHMEVHHQEKGEFKCDVCPKVYTSNQSLKRHTRTMHTEKLDYYSCTFCGKSIIGKENFRTHTLLHHSQGRQSALEYSINLRVSLICEICKINFNDESNLRQHIKQNHGFQAFYNYCKKSLLMKSIGKHGHAVQKKHSLHCEYCFNIYTTDYDLKSHMKDTHDVLYKPSSCYVCFSKFYSNESILFHKTMCIPPVNANKCNLCDKLFTDISSLEFHVRVFHPPNPIADSKITSSNIDDNDTYKCNKCDETYQNESALNYHMESKHFNDVECTICGEVCSEACLSSHMKIVHDKQAFKCKYCGKEFKSKSNLRRHIVAHVNVECYNCIECGTLFKEQRNLRKHIRTKHSNSKSFPRCHLCKKQFESAKSYKVHLRMFHTMHDSHPCASCNKSFETINELHIHHTKHQEAYKCDQCDLVFQDIVELNLHIESHDLMAKNLPRCVICEKDFSSKKTLKRHIKNFHAEFQIDELADFGSRQDFKVECVDCIKNFTDSYHFNVYQKWKHSPDSVIFKCETCKSSYNSLEYSIQRYKQNFDISKSKLYLSELCTTEMSDAESQMDISDMMEPESTTTEIKQERDGSNTLIDSITFRNYSLEGSFDKTEPESTTGITLELGYNIKTEPVSP